MIPKREEELAETERGEEESQVRKQLQEKEYVHRDEGTEGLGERREILIVVFGTMQFTGDLDNSNCNSIMGTKLIGVDGNQGKVKSAKQSTWGFLKSFIVKRGEGEEPREGFRVYDDDCDNDHYHP